MLWAGAIGWVESGDPGGDWFRRRVVGLWRSLFRPDLAMTQCHVIGVVKSAVDPVVVVVRSDAGAGVDHDVVVIGFSLVQQFGETDLSKAAALGVRDAGLR